RSSQNYSLSAGILRGTAANRRSTTTRSAATSLVPAAAARNTRSVMAKLLRRYALRHNRLLTRAGSQTFVLSLLLLNIPAQAGIWPEQFGPAKRVSAKPIKVADQKLWSEYGLQEAEQAEYAAGKTVS